MSGRPARTITFGTISGIKMDRHMPESIAIQPLSMFGTSMRTVLAGRSLTLSLALLLSASLLTGCDYKPFQFPELSKRSESEKQFERIDRAEAITDPIRRCIEYPSPPGVKWPAAMIEAFCRDVHTAAPRADTIKAMIDRQDWNGLRSFYDGHLARHLSGEDQELVLYRAFHASGWRNEDEAERYSRRWLRARPDDPYANTLRAMYLVRRAWETRGTGFAREVSSDNMRRTIALAREASVLLTRAIKVEPKLMPAYTTLIDAYVLGGRSDLMRRVAQAASQESPDNFYVRAAAAEYLRLIWGGTPAELQAIADDASDHVDRNPRLRLLLAKNKAELTYVRVSEKHYGRALSSAREALEYGPDNHALHLAVTASDEVGYESETIVYLSQIIRFNLATKEEWMQRGRLWEYNKFYSRALHDYRAALAIAPHDASIEQRIAETIRKAGAAGNSH